MYADKVGALKRVKHNKNIMENYVLVFISLFSMYVYYYMLLTSNLNYIQNSNSIHF